MVARILVGVGSGRGTDDAVADGLQLASAFNASLVFLHVVTVFDLPIIEAPALAYLTPEQVQSGLEAAATSIFARVNRRLRDAGVNAACAARSGTSIASSIAEFAREHGCDLVVVGTGRSGVWRRLLGGCVANDLLAVADVPLWFAGCHR